GGNGDTVFARLCAAMDRGGLAADPRFATHAARGERQGELDEIISAWTSTLALDDLLSLLEAHGVPAGRIYRAPDMIEDPHFTAREAIISVPHPVFGQVRMQNAFPKLSETPGKVRWPGPDLGAHTDEVLKDVAGLSVEAIAGLRSRGVV
ncbi:MAG: CoA transferase, partial [Phenylobacterium sp.]|nr:CoA transferase [Phenylobacterium sp.]